VTAELANKKKHCFPGDKPDISVYRDDEGSIVATLAGSAAADATEVTIIIKNGSVAKGTEQVSFKIASSGKDQRNEGGVCLSRMDKSALKVGTKLGALYDYSLPEELEHLEGWIVYNITEEGIPQALSQKNLGPIGPVSFELAQRHVDKLEARGHKSPRLPEKRDFAAMQNCIERGLLRKLEIDPDKPRWGGNKKGNLVMIYNLAGGAVEWADPTSVHANVRAGQDVPELKI
jgi:hypothetical protein